MKRLAVIFALYVAAIFCGCSSEYSNVRQLLKEFERTEIILPGDMLLISNGNISLYNGSLSAAGTFFIYYQSVDCSDCLASKLGSLIPLYALASERGLDVKCVIAPVEGAVQGMIEKLTKLNSPYELYLDTSDSFSRLNTALPPDSRFHTFCTDTSGRPFFVGNPCSDAKSYKLFIKSLKSRSL